MGHHNRESKWLQSNTYTCLNPKRMSISHNCYFNKLFHNISEILTYGDRKQVIEKKLLSSN